LNFTNKSLHVCSGHNLFHPSVNSILLNINKVVGT